MKHSFLPVIFLAVTCLLNSPGVLAEPQKATAAEAMVHGESLGGLKPGTSEKDVLKMLGKPEKQGEIIRQEADDTFVQQWKYPSKGLSLMMTSGATKRGAKTIASFIASAGCTLSTKRDIKIGSAESAVRKAYGAFEDKENKAPGQLVAGSVYDGIIFNFEKGKVSRIFFGAAAE